MAEQLYDDVFRVSGPALDVVDAVRRRLAALVRVGADVGEVRVILVPFEEYTGSIEYSLSPTQARAVGYDDAALIELQRFPSDG